MNEIEEFWSERFLMILSDYGKLSPKLNEMRAALDARGIRYRIDRYEGPQQYYGGWVSYGEDGILQGTALQRYQECAFCHSGVSEMFDGMAFPCVRALALHATERAALSADEWINVEDDLTENAEKLRALYERTLPFSVCDACTGLGRNALRYPAAEQLKRAAPSS